LHRRREHSPHDQRFARRDFAHITTPRQVNPVDVIPQLLALGGDSAGFVRAEAFRPLAVEDSKNGELIRTRLSDGLFMAY
ncbi:unnamed protein product, partial [Ectocarpus sp. 12 AP-2014]